MKNFAFRSYRRSSKEKEEASDKTESHEPQDKQSAAYQKRREQVRRAQRTHRERKENYTKSLENEVLQLRSNELLLNQSNHSLQREVDRLRLLLEQSGVPHVPDQHIFMSPDNMVLNMTISTRPVSIMPNPLGEQQMHIESGSAGGMSLWLTEREGSRISKSSEATQRKRSNFGLGKSEADSVDESSSREIQSVVTPPPTQKIGDLNQTDLGMEFVLTLEAPCLNHVQGAACSSDAQPGVSTGHALMASATLLYHAPNQPIDTSVRCQWDTPQIGLEKLLELSERIDFEGDIAPVQAWARLCGRRGFRDLELGQLRALTGELLGEMKCHGFGSVIDEFVFESLVDKVLP
ncbi:hypothetical protein P280DRAFT_474091 [Massarina eburnea CBS 473.64]|uniref:BZIP domain-containing protein n=1 Tax=Massarina eburnea CBS 473.64 TaxID=1395130 RepID=A0A6A6RIX4_9PLEO|nr:hypothetical protein P280DRAFT_474091 [Massarina eburnea CBS 473.64]